MPADPVLKVMRENDKGWHELAVVIDIHISLEVVDT